MQIRPVTASEWTDLQKLNNEVFVDNAKYDPDIVSDWAYSEAGTKYYQEVVHDTQGLCLVAQADDGTLVGYIAASPKEFSYRRSKYLEIDNMGVLPEYRSQGIGRQLMDACQAWAKDHGFNKLFVNAYSANTKAIEFYKRCGFEMIDVSLEREI